MTIQHIHTNGTRGEISPRMLGRTDLQGYHNAWQTLLNFHVMRQGPIIRRSGTRYVATQKDQTKQARLIEFQFSTTQTYVLLVEEGFIRFFRDQGQLIDPTPGGTPTQIANPYLESDLASLKFAQSNDTLTICRSLYTPRILSRTNADDSESSTWSLDMLRFIDGPWLDINDTDTTITPSALSGSVTLTASAAIFVAGDAQTATARGRQVRIRHDYREDEQVITAATVANPAVFTVAGHGYDNDDRIRLTDLVGTGGGTNWSTLNDRFFTVKNITSNTFTLEDSSGAIDSSAFNAYTASSGHISVSTAPLLHGWGVAEITAYTSGTEVTASIVGDRPFRRATASVFWRLGAWSESQGWPRVVTHHKGRAWYANNAENPQTLWASEVGKFNKFAPSDLDDDTISADHSLTFTLDDDQVNEIQYLVSSDKGLAILTLGGVFLLNSGDASEPISALAFSVLKQNNAGSASRVQPVRTSEEVLYISSSTQVVREMRFEFERDKFAAPDLTAFSEHILVGGCTDSAFQQEPNNCLWLVRADGQLVACAIDRQEQVIAWHRHVIGGSFSGGEAVVESIACIRDGQNDLLYLTVKRTIDGGTKRYVEILQPAFAINGSLSAGYFSDSHVTGSVSGVTSVSGLSHLNGQTVAVQINGAVGATAVVSGGAITIPLTTGVVTVGLPYQSDGELPPPVVEQSRGRKIRPHKVDLVLHNAVGGKVSGDGVNYDQIPYVGHTPGALFTGIESMPVSCSNDKDPFIRIRQSDPVPLTLLGAITWLEVDGH